MDSKKQPDFAVGIIGAGFAGIIAAMQLQRDGRENFVIFERAKAIGGTWRDNHYPGCACDVPSHLYSIAAAPNPSWSRMFSPQPEILAYMQRVVQEHGLEQYIRYEADIVRAEFSEEFGNWTLTDRQGRITTVKAVIAALGPLNRAKWPEIAGIQAFEGHAFHTSQWDHAVALKGKKVAVIGTGASAIQVVPAIASEVAALTVFQRTAAWISNRNDHAISEKQQRRFQRFPGLQRLMRNIIYEVLEVRGRLFIGNRMIHRMLQKQCIGKLAREVEDPMIRQKLTPNYTLGCKRILLSDDYLPTFNRPNVALETTAIREISANAIHLVDGKTIPVDVIIFSTGFDAAEINTDAKVLGIKGRELFSEWAISGMEAFKGTTFSGYPNFTYLLGPNTGLGHSSVLHIMESQMPYILQYLDLLDRQGANGYLDVKANAQNTYNAELQAKFQGTVWASGCKSWYLNSQGKNTTLYPRLTRAFRHRMAKFDAENYAQVIQQ
jgi:cation diffusion facilitator CzcD-associated flavoprotein CzcO